GRPAPAASSGSGSGAGARAGDCSFTRFSLWRPRRSPGRRGPPQRPECRGPLTEPACTTGPCTTYCASGLPEVPGTAPDGRPPRTSPGTGRPAPPPALSAATGNGQDRGRLRPPPGTLRRIRVTPSRPPDA